MELLTPGVGLIFWQLVVFLLLVFVLGKFAWKPILNALKIREESIEEALNTAEQARQEMEKLKADNAKLLDEARHEREEMLKEARTTANAIKDEARADASKATEKMITDARAAIEAEKKAAMADVRNQITDLSIMITEKVLLEKLSQDKAQKDLINNYIKELKLN